jgi:hypothetical protein
MLPPDPQLLILKRNPNARKKFPKYSFNENFVCLWLFGEEEV